LSQPTVVYDARFLQPKTRHWGVGVFIERIVNNLASEFNFVGLAENVGPAAENIRTWPRGRLIKPLFFEFSPLLVSNYDAYWGTNHFLPALLRCPSVLTVHDMLLLNRIEPRRSGGFLSQRFTSSLKRATRIVTHSRAVAGEMTVEFPDLWMKTEVVPLGYDVQSFGGEEVKLNVKFPSSPYAVVLGAHRPRKNLNLAIAAAGHLRDRGVDFCLIITGNVDPSFRKLLQASSRWVIEAGVLPKQTVLALLERAVCLFFPSRYEGFGLPLLEAMAAGCPVLALETPINREVGGEAAWLLPDDPCEWAAAVRRLMDSPTLVTEMKERGRNNLARFSWKKTADTYGKIFKEVTL
jgi:glycosyltransferase involved in cell wall biosynthesis